MDEVAAHVKDLPMWAAALLALVENALILVVGVGLGTAVLRLRTVVRLLPDPGRIDPLQGWLAASAVLLNTAVTVVGWKLWTLGVIRFDLDVSWRIAVDLLLLVLAMDFASYVGHALAHVRWLYPLGHRLHHRFVDARPITLFALHPGEVIGFGALWLVMLSIVPLSVWALVGYTVINLVFGIFGHLGVEPLPLRWRPSRPFAIVATPTMHAMHHLNPARNLGFYTTIWDRLFRTLDDDYDRCRRNGHSPLPSPPPLATPATP
ncbi:sterol desaturase family protein [Catellatospora tritici]|uniref:sterol desaturase family protein n=1 Tax=Catellatospora tritici TaxID=2851566 RepID=UPI001C2D98EF|nr:sterol desaturase family protein [Catellatospora tritici]MBV1849343.1 sterol desaturase family protein [Catellatospora tritici]